MKSFTFKIKDRAVLQEYLINHFKGEKYVFFFNSNNENEKNILAVSNSEKIEENNWKIGFVSYDYKNNIEELTSNHTDNIGFDEEFFFTPELLFQISQNTIEVLYNEAIYAEEKILEIVNEVGNSKIIISSNIAIKTQPKITKQTYLDNVEHLKSHIQQGDIYEINYCQEFYANEVEINPIELYFKLNRKSPTPYSCFVKHNHNYLLSASPERFIKKQGNKISSQPIKGTIKRGATLEEDEGLKNQLKTDPKERSENIMIVDLVRNDLAKIAQRNTVKVDELCEIYTFPQVHQMISTISAELKKEVDFKQIIHALFPMGSMTGAPKIRAMELIEQYETSKRGLYSGTVGFIKPNGDFDFNVVIRSILYNASSKNLSYFVGGAITSLSVPEKEYEECLLKAKAINEVLGASPTSVS